ncbi:MAG: hypothetical protein AUJ23_03085 [Candidatus Magasanikbacteria bacterium CG1_02_32_51]|uniref:Addiction module toxin RelE n=1 Tax=Candidatus Magasanikbacteria bacterium CG1_02_32_51 TaxID=1805238 RepID=A0A1J4U949_9BACT|nr:MAG: hypothetical protein AUJ23_03085 [Candidatus Magasanikbacteria bacterium CG1_02_32_51]
MKIDYSRKFIKKLKKSNKKIRVAFYKKLNIFRSNIYDQRLENHKLNGEIKNLRSINITGDWRALYIDLDDKIEWVEFVDLGTHSELYK